MKLCYCIKVKKNTTDLKLNEIQLTLSEFLQSFNQNMSAGFPKVSEAQLLKFKSENESFFRKGDTWSLDQHRKKVIDWLPRNKTTA